MCSQLAHLRKNKQRFFIVTKCYEKYLKKPGVWALKGKVGKNGEFEYLEVGQTKDIKTELEFIIKLLMKDYSTVKLEKNMRQGAFSQSFRILLMYVTVIKIEELQNIVQFLCNTVKLFLS